MLDELAGLGMRIARAVAVLSEIEQAAGEAVARWLPEPGADASVDGSLAEAVAAGQGMDAVKAAMAAAVPRVEMLARAFDRVARSVRRTVALQRRIAAGWPRAGSPDDRPAMVRRQVARGVGQEIRRKADGEAAERLFDELAELLDDPAFAEECVMLPVAEVVRRICCALGLAVGSGVGVAVVGRVDTG